MKKSILFIVVALLVVSIVVVGCQGKATAPASSAAPAATSAKPASSAPASAAATGGVIKIGHLRPMTGSMAIVSQEMTAAFNWAFERVNYQVAGKTIQIIEGDSQGDPEKAIDAAKKLVENDHVALIVGPTQGGEMMGAAGYLNQVGIPQFITTQEPPPIIIQKMRWTLSSGGTELQSPAPMAKYALEKGNIKTVDALSGDFAPGHGFLGAFVGTFKKLGGTVQQEIYTPYPTQDFSPYLTSLKPADAMVAWLDGDQAIKLLTQYHEFGIDKKMPVIGASWGAFLAPYILGAMPSAAADACIGYLVPTAYTPLDDNPVNQQWVTDFKAKFGFTPEDTSAGAYQGAQIIIEALKATNGETDPEKLRQAILDVKFKSIFGDISFDASTGVRHMNMNISKIVKKDKEYLWQPVFTYQDVPPLGY
jgi:branched-chain amino acid transport system substrate-binding protein